MLVAHSAAAQTPLNNGANHPGTLVVGTTNIYTFSATSGDRIVLRAAAGTYTPRIVVYDPNGAPLGGSTSATSNNRDGEVSVPQAPETGNYTARISSYYAGGSGDYILRFARIPGDFMVSVGDEGGPMANGLQHSGTVDMGDLDVWTFMAATGDNIVLRMGGVGFVPSVRLYGPDGALLSASTSSSSNDREGEAAFRATNSGSFTVVASAYSLNGTGDYILTLAKSPGAISVAPGDTGGPLTNGWQHTGTIDVGDLDLWGFMANPGDSIVLRMGGTGFTPYIRLYGPDGALLSESSSFSSNDRDGETTFRATNSGPFTVVVGAYRVNGTGAYILALAKSPGAIAVAPGDTGGPLTNGWLHSGVIDVGDLDVWTFTAEAGDSIVTRIGGTGFTPRIRLYGPDGALLSESSSFSSNDRDGEASFRANSSGNFIAVAGAYRVNGTGAYILTFAKSPGEIAIAPGDDGGPLTNGWKHSGVMDVGDLDVWTLTAEVGDSIVTRMGGTGFTPRIRLYGPDGALLSESSSFSSNDRDGEARFRATNSGPFTVMASAYRTDGAGAYTITLAKSPGEIAIAPGDEGGTLTNGLTNVGTNSVGDLEVWRFFGTTGDSNVFRMVTTNFTPWLRLYAPSGALIREAFAASTANRSNGVSIVITNEGYYTLVTSAYYFNQSGTYSLKQSRVPPDLIVPNTQFLNEGGLLNVSLSAQNPDEPDKLLTFALVSAPPGALLTPAGNTNATLTWATTEGNGPSTNLIVARVTDVVNGTAFIRTNSFEVIVNEINEAPQLTVPGPQTVHELTALNVSALATDVDIPANTLTFSLISPPPGMSIHPVTGAITWTPTEAQGPSTNLITVVVTDFNPHAVNEQHLSDTNSFTVIVREVNTPPVLTVPSNRTINELTTLNVSASATDADLPVNPLVFSLISPPAGMIINPTTGAILWTPTEAQGPGVYTITVRVTDSSPSAVNEQQLSDTKSFTVTVNEVNHAPQLTVPSDRTIDELTPLNVSASATDSDFPANPLTFVLVSPPGGMTINPVTGALSWTPTEAQGPSTNLITVVVTDTNAAALVNKQLSTTNTFTVTVNEVNHAPQLTVPSDRIMDELTAFNVSVSATDSDVPNNPLTFSLLSPPSGMTINANSGAIAWTPTEAQGPSTNVITVIVTDTNAAALANQRLSATNTFTVTVLEVNLAPVLQAINDQSLHYGFPLSVQAVASDPDLPANTLTFSLGQAPEGMTIAANGLITWTPAQNQVATHPVTVRVEDDGSPSLSATQSFQVTVTGEGSSLEISILPGTNLKQIDIFGDIGLTYELQYSTNLSTWSRLLRFTLDTSPYPYVDSVSATQPFRFYRLELVEE